MHVTSGATVARKPATTGAIPGRRADIQGLRAIAVLAVVAFHAGLPVHGGFVGVDIFFVISGFVITAMLHREWQVAGRIRMGQFYWRRFKRLTPALALVVSVTVLLSAVILSPLGPQQTAAYTGIGASLIVANFVIAATTGGYFDAPAEANPLLHTWSLSVEEQFYLLFPAVIATSWAIARGRSRLRLLPWLSVTAIAAGSFLLVLLESYGPNVAPFGLGQGFYGPITRCWEFAVGALLALIVIRGYRPNRTTAALAGPAGVVLLVPSLFLISEAMPWPSLWTLLPVTATLLLLWSGSESAEPAVTRALSGPTMVRVGDLSYSIYLWHWPLIVFAGILWPTVPGVELVAAAFSFLPAMASFSFVEQPLRRWKPVNRRSGSKMVAAALLVPLSLSGALVVIANHYWKPRIDSLTADAKLLPATHAGGCFHGLDQDIVTPDNCVWHKDATGRPVYLVGDSNAAHYSDGMILTTGASNRPLYANTSTGCPLLLDMYIIWSNRPKYDQICQARVQWVVNWLAASEPGTVIISAANGYQLDPTLRIVDKNGVQAQDEVAKVAVLKTSLQDTVETVQAAGHAVVIVQTVPQFIGEYQWDPAQCSIVRAVQGCPQTMPLQAEVQRSAAVRRAVSEVAKNTGARLVDLDDALCPDGLCRTRSGNFPVYRDGGHISVAKSRQLASTFQEWIR